MFQITLSSGREGPFKAVLETSSAYLVTGVNDATAVVPKSVVGAGTVEAWVGELPSPPPSTMSSEQLQAEVVSSTQRRLDDFAKLRNYDGILSVCTYASSAIPRFAAEAQVGIAARDQTWATLYSLLDEINSGVRPVPSGYADIEPLLPTLEWPSN